MNCICAKPTCARAIVPRDFKLQCVSCGKEFHFKCTQITDDTNNAEKAAGETYAKKMCFKLYLCVECDAIPFELLRPLIGMSKDISEIKKECAVISSLTDAVMNMAESINEIRKQVNKVDKSFDKIEKSDSKWSDLFKSKSEALPNTHNVLLKPLDKNINRGAVFDAMKTKLDENEFELAGCRMNGKNGVVIAAANKESQDKIIAKATELLGVDFQVKPLREMKPRIKILNAKIKNGWNGSDTAIERFFKDRNEMLRDAVFVLKIERRKYVSTADKAYDIIMEVDVKTFNHYTSGNTVRSSWAASSRVVEGIRVKRCMKCLHFGHSKDQCAAQHSVCGKCGGEDHLSKDRKSKEAKCVNCVSANKNAKKTIFEPCHNTLSYDCPCYKIQFKKISNLISYE
jgi:hypothetical protein